MKRNSLPSWYPAACHTENLNWTVQRWLDELAYRSYLIRAESEGRLDMEYLNAVIQGDAEIPNFQMVKMQLPIDVSEPDTVLLQRFMAELDKLRKQPFSPEGSGICQQIAKQKSKFKLLGLMEGLGKLHQLKVLDWIDLSLWSKLSGVRLEAQFLGDIFWPYEDVDRRYRLSTRTRPLACQLMGQSVIFSLLQVKGE